MTEAAVDGRQQPTDQGAVIQIDALAAVGGDDGQIFLDIVHVQLVIKHGLNQR